MWTTEHSAVAGAGADDVWNLYADVSTWPEWDHGVERVSLDGPFAAGSTGRLKPRGGREVKFTLTGADPGRGFVDETRLPLATMRFEHQLRSHPDGTQISHRVTIECS